MLDFHITCNNVYTNTFIHTGEWNEVESANIFLHYMTEQQKQTHTYTGASSAAEIASYQSHTNPKASQSNWTSDR